MMSNKTLKEKAKNLELKKNGKHNFIRQLIIDGFLDTPVTSTHIVLKVREKFGKKFQLNHVQTYMQKFMSEGIVHAIKHTGIKGNFWVLTNISRERAIQAINKDKGILKAENDLFSNTLMKKLKRDFGTEFEDLQHNFGKSGTCTAFLLRKILEKLIYITFSRNGVESKLEDKAKVGGLVGLETMINTASLEKIRGIPFLTPKTAKDIKGIKFLGDAAAHNPLVNVDMKTIIPQMPYIITAYEELAKKL